MARQHQLNDQEGGHELTIAAMADVDDAGADTQEKHAVLLVLRAELGHCDIHPGLGDGVQRRRIKVKLAHGLDVGVATREVNDLLDLALQDEREEELDEVDVAEEVGVDEAVELGVELLDIVGAAWSVLILCSVSSSFSWCRTHSVPMPSYASYVDTLPALAMR
jgi:hypothetical protein